MVADPAPGPRVRVPLELSVRQRLLAAGWSVESGPIARRTVDLYDTGDRRLAAAGAELTFSRRDGWLWRRDPSPHPKLGVREWSSPASASDSAVSTWSRAYRRGRPLARRATVCIQRRHHHVTAPKFEAPVVVVEERVDELRDGAARAVLRRVSVAAGEDDRDVGRVRAVFSPLALEGTQTLSVLRATAAHARRLEPPRPDAIAPRDLLMRSLVLSTIQWLYFDCEMAGPGTPDSIRKVRIAARRIRTDLQTFGVLLDPVWTGALRDRIGALTTRLGTVRDAEVLAGRLAELAALLPDGEREACLPLVDRAATHLSLARDALLGELAAAEYIELVDSVVAAVSEPRWADAADPVTDVAPLAARRWRRLRKYVSSLTETPTNEELHRVRVLAKRVRYAVEASIPAAGEAAARCAERIIVLQTVLGEHHDAAVTREWLQREAADGGPAAFAAGQLAALELGRLREATARWRDVWNLASRRRDWRWLRS